VAISASSRAPPIIMIQRPGASIMIMIERRDHAGIDRRSVDWSPCMVYYVYYVY
jgi:hypothetical protein